MYQAVIFDMDGVIIDSEPFHEQIDEEVLRELGVQQFTVDMAKFVGMNDFDQWIRIKAHYGLSQSVDQLMEVAWQKKVAHVRNGDYAPIPGVTDILRMLRTNGKKIGLASSSKRMFIHAVLEKLVLTDVFDVIVGGDDCAHGKPAPDIYLKAIGDLQLTPDVCIAIEDSTNGSKAAKAAGMKCIGYQNPQSGSQDLRITDLIVQSLHEVDDQLLKKVMSV